MTVAETVLRVEGDDEFSPKSSSKRKVCRSASLPFSPLTMIDRFSRKISFSYNQLPEEPIRLSVLKLDGSSFDIFVAKAATIADLRQAVEAAFSHMPKKGPGKISWQHVWAHFCLSYDGQKLLTDSDYLRNYGIKDGDQLHFSRHISITYKVVRKRSKKPYFALKLANMSSPKSSSPANDKEISEEDNDFEDVQKGKQKHNKIESSIAQRPPKLIRYLKGWFPYTRLAVVGRARTGSKIHPSRLTSCLLGKFRRILRLGKHKHGSKRYVSTEDL